MPDLFHSLLNQDIGHLRIIAEVWGLELKSKDADAAREKLSVSLLEPGLLAELIGALSPEADSAITTLVNSGGRIPWPTFTRRYGEIREAGAGKRDREKLHRNPASTTEALYYRGLLARAFFDTEKGPQEFAYIPDDLLELIREEKKSGVGKDADEVSEDTEALGRPASPRERGQEIPAGDSILDDATTVLAALRLGMEPPETKIPSRVILGLLQSAKIIENTTPQLEPAKTFLESPRREALKMLTDAWVESETFNELRLIPGIVCEGEWKNEPQETREFLLNLLDDIPPGTWWSLNAFIRDIHQKYPDFQRPAGDYDSWFVKRESDGQYLRGFAFWDQVDGALIKYFITGILHWLGQVDLCITEGAAEPISFRVANLPPQTTAENRKLHISSQGLISVPRLAPRAVRYQISRFCEWEESKEEVYRYRISTKALAKAREQGLKVEHLLALLAKHSEAGIPPALIRALKRWEVNGTEARVQAQVILKVSKPEIMEEMRRSRAAKFLGEVLSPTTVVVKPGAIQKVMDALAELGLLAEVTAD
ncbi:MAG TPA: helicase-associated domain-containing protein [Anaerolineales bacterium]|nr:helicase-associated domain-containing protein [Anaerolineales bacterium]